MLMLLLFHVVVVDVAVCIVFFWSDDHNSFSETSLQLQLFREATDILGFILPTDFKSGAEPTQHLDCWLIAVLRSVVKVFQNRRVYNGMM